MIRVLTRVTEVEIEKLYCEPPSAPSMPMSGPQLYAVRRDGRGLIVWPPLGEHDILHTRAG